MILYCELDNLISQGKDDRPLCTKPAIFKGVKKIFNSPFICFCVGLRDLSLLVNLLLLISASKSAGRCLLNKTWKSLTLGEKLLGPPLVSQSTCQPRVCFFFFKYKTKV